MGCPDDYTIQAIMRWGYPAPQDPRIDDLLRDIDDLKLSIASVDRKIEPLVEKRNCFLEDMQKKEAELASLGYLTEERREKYDKFMDM